MEDRFSLRGSIGIVVAACVAAGALNQNATAAVGLVAPGLQEIDLPRGQGLLIDPNTRIPGLVSAKTPAAELRVQKDVRARAEVAELKKKLGEQRHARARANVSLGVLLGLLALLALGTRSAYLGRAAVLAA